MPVPVGLRDTAGGRGGEQETHAGLAPLLTHAQRPVLIVRREARCAGAALADDINILARPQVIELHPRFERDGIAVRKIKAAAGAGVVEGEPRAVAIELHGRVVRIEVRGLRRARAGHVTMHAAMGRETGRFLRAKIPACDDRRRSERAGQQKRHERGQSKVHVAGSIRSAGTRSHSSNWLVGTGSDLPGQLDASHRHRPGGFRHQPIVTVDAPPRPFRRRVG